MVQPVDTTAPSRQVWRPGLISAARQTQNLHEGDELARRAADGLAYAPEYPAAGTGDRSFDLCADNGSNITWPTSTADTLTFSPFGISHYEACPVIGANVAELAAKARRVLAERTSHLVEEVLWTGLLDEGTSIETMAGDNRRLASSAASLIDGSGAHDITVAMGLINEWAAATVGPYRVWVHAEPRLAPFLSFYNSALRIENGQGIGESLSDHRVVIGTGYTGSSAQLSAGADESWLIVTNPVRVVLGEIVPNGDGVLDSFVDRDRNRVRVQASRPVVADWDLTVHAAIKVCLPAPGPACE